MSAAAKDSLSTDSHYMEVTFIKDPMAMSKGRDSLNLHILAKS